MEFLGNISLRLVGVLATVATLAAVYFFIVKPITDTTKDAFDSVAPAFESLNGLQENLGETIKDAQKESRARPGDNGLQVDIQKLQRCVEAAGQDVNKLQRCATRYTPTYAK